MHSHKIQDILYLAAIACLLRCQKKPLAFAVCNKEHVCSLYLGSSYANGLTWVCSDPSPFPPLF